VLVLLDENLLSRKLKQPLIEAGHTVSNVNDMGWRGLSDREILALAENHPFDVFITADKNLPYQQNLNNLTIRIIALDSGSTRPDHLAPLITKVSALLSSLPVGAVVRINNVGEVTPVSF
jgi:predicted nuclease of predicted toxin-antitoxin system